MRDKKDRRRRKFDDVDFNFEAGEELDSYEIRKRKRKAQEKMWIQILVGIVAGLIMLGLLYCGYLVFSNNLWLDRINGPKQGDESSSLENQVNILVLGVDIREDDVGRSDTIFLVSLDPKTHRMFQLSIPRDTRVYIPDHGWDKINHSYSYGGKDLTTRTVEHFLGVKVDHVVEIDFQGFYRIVDAIGGVDIDVEKRMYYEDPWDEDGGLVIDLRPGMQHLDGRTAITYVRYRDEDGDIGRIERQQRFMKAVIDKVSSPSIITRLPAILSEVNSAVQTDLSTLELLNLGRFFKESREMGLDANMGMVPGGGYYIDGISYWIPDMEVLLSALDEFDDNEASHQWVGWAKKHKNFYLDSLPVFDDEDAGGYYSGGGGATNSSEEEDDEEDEEKSKEKQSDSKKPENQSGSKEKTPQEPKSKPSGAGKTETEMTPKKPNAGAQ